MNVLPLTAHADAQDWSGFRGGQQVVLQHASGSKLGGVLDMRTDDASVVWVLLHDGGGRRLIHREDGYRLRHA